MKNKKEFKKYPVRIPTAKPTVWFKDKKKYNRKVKYKSNYEY